MNHFGGAALQMERNCNFGPSANGLEKSFVLKSLDTSKAKEGGYGFLSHVAWKQNSCTFFNVDTLKEFQAF